MPESRWGAPDRKLSADLADANKRLAAYRELADDRGYYLRHNIPGLREEIKDTRPEISLSQIMVTKRASVVSTATQAEPSNSAAYHALQLAMTGKQFEFNADRVAFAKVTDARLPERINDKEVEIAVPESLGVAREAGSWVNDNGDPVADLTSEIRQTAQGNEAEDSDFKAAAEEHRQAGLEWLREQERAEMEPAPAIEEPTWLNEDDEPVEDLDAAVREARDATDRPSVEEQIQRGEAAVEHLKALGNDPRYAGKAGVGVLQGEMDARANLAHLRNELLLDLEAEQATNKQRLRESGGAILPERLTPEAIAAASKLWNTDAKADLKAQAGDVPEEKAAERPNLFQRVGYAIGDALDRSGEWLDSWTNRPERQAQPQEIPHSSAATATPNGPRAEEISGAIRLARDIKTQERAADISRVMESAGIDTKREAKWILFKADVQSRLMHPFSSEARSAEREIRIQNGIDAITDRKADKLIKEHGEALKLINPNKEIGPHNAHLLPAKEYQAALKVHNIDQRLRQLRPESQTVGAAHAQARGQAIERVDTPRVAESAGVRQEGPQLVPKNSPAERRYASALQAVNEYNTGAVRLEGYQHKPTSEMRKSLLDQLKGAASMEAAGREPERIDLSVRYNGKQGTNLVMAQEAHAKALDDNSDLIKIVKDHGIGVDSGKVTFVSPGETQKKSEAIVANNGIGASA